MTSNAVLKPSTQPSKLQSPLHRKSSSFSGMAGDGNFILWILENNYQLKMEGLQQTWGLLFASKEREDKKTEWLLGADTL